MGAVDAIAQGAETGDKHAISAIVARFDHNACDVKSAAVKAISKVAEKGDHHAITAITTRFDHHDHAVREAALTAISQVTERVTTMSLMWSWRALKINTRVS